MSAAGLSGWKRIDFRRTRAPLLIALCVIAVFWKLVLTDQYTFLESPDHARQIMPWLDVQVRALRHFSLLLWDPYVAGGQSLIGQVQPAVLSPFTWLLALAPPDSSGHIRVFYVNLWFVLIHILAAWFAYALFRDLKCPRLTAALGGVFYATGGDIGNMGWPQILAASVWTPLVFLFLLRSLRGRTPIKSAASAGAFLGISWLCGHHVPSTYLTLAVFGTGLYYLLARPGFRLEIIKRLSVTAAVMLLVSAAQTLPAIEYGKLSLRWTQTGAYTWDQKVPVPEHEDLGLKPSDLLRVLIPGGSGLIADPFVGCVALSLVLFAVIGDFRNRNVRFFCILGLCGLFASMPRNNVFYGFIYAFVPIADRSREPIEALALFHFSVAALAALGARVLTSAPDFARNQSRPAIKLLLWFAGITLGLFYLHPYFNVPSPIMDGDPRMAVIAVLGLLAAGIYQAMDRGYLSRTQAVTLLLVLLVLEQGNEVGYYSFIHQSDPLHANYLRPLTETQDLADFLRREPDPKRIEWNTKDLDFSFGDWNRIPAMATSGASAPTRFHSLNPWSDRVSQLYGVGYTISRSPTRPNQREVFSDPNGYKIFANPDAFPRAWTVHEVKVADESDATKIVSSGTLDLRSTAVITGTAPALTTCNDADRMRKIEEQPQSASIAVQMGCAGLLVVSDNWFPGWRANVDGKAAAILRVDSNLRGIALGSGLHHVRMIYSPASVYVGLLLLVIGLSGAIYLQLRREADAADALATIALSSHAGSRLGDQLTRRVHTDVP